MCHMHANNVLCICVVKLLLNKLREQTLQGLIERRQKLISTLQNVSCIVVCYCDQTTYRIFHGRLFLSMVHVCTKVYMYVVVS